MITKKSNRLVTAAPAISLPMARALPCKVPELCETKRDWMQRILRIAMAVLMLAVMVPSALAAT